MFQENQVTWSQTFPGGLGEIRLNPGEIQHGIQQFYIECGAYDQVKDWVSYKHFVEVLCKYYYRESDVLSELKRGFLLEWLGG